ncbi:aromatic prenyltransferase [Aspergillus spectabilis]
MLLSQISVSHSDLATELPSSLETVAPSPSHTDSQYAQNNQGHEAPRPRLRTLNEDEVFWSTTTATVLSRLLDQANYDARSKSFYMSFYSQFVLPAFGPRPQSNNTPFWRSFVTDDFSPIEYSWNFTAKQESTIRFAIEPISVLAGTAEDPFNQIAPAEFLELTKSLGSDVDLSWYNTLADALYMKRDASASAQQQFSPRETASQAFVGFDLNRQGKLAPKVYMMPNVKAAWSGTSPLELVTAALQRIEVQGTNILIAWKVVQSYIRSQPAGSIPAVEIISFDCVGPQSPSARIKVYVRSPNMSLAVAKDMFTLGGRVVAEDTPRALDLLEELWRLLLNIPLLTPEDAEVSPRNESHANHRTGGVIFNYELTPGFPIPEPKLYIPVRHYANSDLAIAEGLAAFFRRHGWASHGNSYVGSVTKVL